MTKGASVMQHLLHIDDMLGQVTRLSVILLKRRTIVRNSPIDAVASQPQSPIGDWPKHS